jgi:hypothetical protein
MNVSNIDNKFTISCLSDDDVCLLFPLWLRYDKLLHVTENKKTITTSNNRYEAQQPSKLICKPLPFIMCYVLNFQCALCLTSICKKCHVPMSQEGVTLSVIILIIILITKSITQNIDRDR